MRAFFCQTLSEKDCIANLPPEEKKHIFKVLRANDGDHIILLDGKGKSAVAKIASNNQAIIESVTTHSKPPIAISLFVAPPRQGGMDQIISYACETNVSEITPIICDFSVSIPNNIGKWEKKIIESCKQSKKPFFPKINPPRKLDDALKNAASSSKIFFGDTKNNEQKIDLYNVQSISWFVGPEGGFSQTELDAFGKFNASPLKISPYIMRICTAALAGIILLSETFRRQNSSDRFSCS